MQVQAEAISIGDIIGSGSFAEVRRGQLRGRAGRSPGAADDSVTEVAVKVLRDVSRQSLRRFWFEVLIMKVGGVTLEQTLAAPVVQLYKSST